MSSLPDLPDPESITDESSAAGALSTALVAAATANRTLSVASAADEERERGPRHAKASVPSAEWEKWLRDFHRLLVKIAIIHSELISWSVSVGTDFSLTVNFAPANGTSLLPGLLEPSGDNRTWPSTLG